MKTSRSALSVFLGFILLLAGQAAQAQSNRTDPVLQLNSGGPTGITRDMVLTSDGGSVITGGDDQPIRIWSTATGELEHVLRGEVGYGIAGAVTAMALSPDDRWLAVGIFFPHQENGREVRGYLRIYDIEQKKLHRVLPGHASAVLSLDFSASGRYLVSGEGSEQPVAVVWDTSTWQKLNELRGHEGQIYGVAFTDEEHVASAGWDETVRLWSWKSGRADKVMKKHKANIMSLAYSPATNQLATGGMDKAIYIWDATSGKQLRHIKTRRNLYKIAFTPDGSHLVASSRGEGNNAYVEVIRVAKGKVVNTYKDPDFTVIAMLVTHDGTEVISAGGSRNEIDFWSLTGGDRRLRIVGNGSPHFAVGLSADGRTVYWGDQQDDVSNGPLHYQMRLSGPQNTLGRPKRIENKPRNVVRARHKVGKLSLERKRKSGGYYSAVLEIKRKGKVIGRITRDSRSGHKHRSYTFTPDGKYVISGALVGRLGIYDLQGNKLGSFDGHLGVVTDLAVSNDGKFLVSSSRDQTIRLWDIAGRKLLLSIFAADNEEWIAWLPDGRYASSAKGDEYIGWQLNRGIDKDADYFQAAQFRERLFRPDVIDDKLHTLLGLNTQGPPQPEFAQLTAQPGTAIPVPVPPTPPAVVTPEPPAPPVKIVTAPPPVPPAIVVPDPVPPTLPKKPAIATGIGTIVGGLTKLKDFSIAALEEPAVAPPSFKVLSPANKTKTKQQQIDVQLAFDSNPNPVDRVDVYLNGSRTSTRGLGVKKKADAHTRTVNVTLQPGENNIELIAHNAVGRKALTLTVLLEGSQRPGQDKGTLYLVTVGVNEYQNLEQDLAFAAADATDFSSALIETAGHLYNDVKSVVLADGVRTPSGQNILQAVELFEQATAQDTVVLFLAGHGVMDAGDYLFLPTEAKLNPSGWDRSSVVPWQDIQAAMAGSAGRRILFVDTCKAGNAFNSRLVKDAADSNIVVMTSTDGETLAQERTKLGHGVFTYAILQGLKGEADSFKDGKVTMSELNAYITNSVSAITDGEQLPVLHVPGGFRDFAFATL